MADKQWYIKVGGTQQGPYSEAELRDLIARTEVSADTLVWCNPMPNWVRAADMGLTEGAPTRCRGGDRHRFGLRCVGGKAGRSVRGHCLQQPVEMLGEMSLGIRVGVLPVVGGGVLAIARLLPRFPACRGIRRNLQIESVAIAWRSHDAPRD